MSFVNYHTKEVNCKVVYYGPGLGGKTTSLQYIYKKTSHSNNSEIMNIGSENERTIFFDFLPLDIGEINDYKARLHLYTVPGQPIYESSRKLVLRGVDGIVFVADSQLERMEDNIKSLNDLEKNMKELGLDISQVPMVMQWNKRDLANAVPVEELEDKLNKWECETFETEAVSGKGVFESMKTLYKSVLFNLKSTI